MEPYGEYETDVEDDYLTKLSDYYSDYGEYEEGIPEDDEEEEEEEEEAEDEVEEVDIYADLMAQFEERRTDRLTVAAEAKKEFLRELIGIRREKDVSRSTLITPEEVSSVSSKLSTESSTHPCLKDIDISDSQLKLHNLYTKFPIPDDPGLVPAFWTTQEYQAIYPEDGVQKFEDLIKMSGIRPIRSLKTMFMSDKISLQYYGVNSRIIRPLCEALMKNHSVETVDLTGNWLSEDACYHLNDLLRTNNVITTLLLAGCQIGPKGAAKLYDGLTRNVTLTTLDLSNCNIGSEGLDHIASAMSNNESIHNLSLNNNHLDESCADTLQKLLSSYMLQYLDLSWNSLYTADTWRKMCRALESNEALVDLDLSWNALGKECVPHLRRLLQRSLALKKLDLSGNRFYNEDIDLIARSLSRNDVLEEIYFGDNPFKAEGALALVKALTPDKAPESQLQVLDLTNIWANKDILPDLQAIKDSKPWLQIKLGGIFSNYKVEGPDVKAILLKRANFEAMKPKNKRRRRNFGHFVLSLEDNVISRGKFVELVKDFKLKLSQSLIRELMGAFAATRHSVDQGLLKSTYMKHFPDTKLPPEKPAKKKKATSPKKEARTKVKKKTKK
ncbi:uncharacterized protein LOC100877744 isoform X2 [Megachile rotundata]|uniref:uncharacterized protein LOC100877744 isoform X2 n=1 Tax=Megachile rotundata TaxID=143995 RepID=UPI000258ED26